MVLLSGEFYQIHGNVGWIILVLSHPDQGLNIPAVLSSSVRRGKPVDQIGIPSATREQKILPFRKLLEKSQFARLTVFDPIYALTDENGIISAEMGGVALYSDHFHLSSEGAARVAEVVLPVIAESLYIQNDETADDDSK
jgi:hypothetical protein